MSVKVVTFKDSDKELVERIRRFQEEQHLPSFIAAVRALCLDALDLKRLLNK